MQGFDFGTVLYFPRSFLDTAARPAATDRRSSSLTILRDYNEVSVIEKISRYIAIYEG